MKWRKLRGNLDMNCCNNGYLFMASYDMEQSEEMLQLMKLSACLERCKPELDCDLDVPEKLTRAAHSENFFLHSK